MTLGKWLLYWLEVYAPIRCLSGATLDRYRRLSKYLGTTPELAALAETALCEVTHQTIESSLLTLLRAPAIRRRHLSRRSIRHFGGLLSVALGKASRLDLIPSNPMLKVELPAAETPRARSLTLEEVQRLRVVAKGNWASVFIELALATGCRRGELLALEWQDVDYKSHALSVSKSVEETPGGLRLKLPKSGRARACTLPHSMILLLPRFDAAGEVRRGLIFAGPNGTWRSPALVSQLIVRLMRKARIENASLHSLRHTHATVLLSGGVPVSAVSQRLGHADPNITLRTYCHAMPLDDQRVADQWDRLMPRPAAA